MTITEAVQKEADDLIEAAQALEEAARKLKADAKLLRWGRLLPGWGYTYGRIYMHNAAAKVDQALNVER